MTTCKRTLLLKASAAVILAILSIATYHIALSNGFAYDDNLQVLKNRWITDARFLTDILTTSGAAFLNKKVNTYRPMLHMVFMADYHIFGLKPWGYHATNIIIHYLNSVIFFLTAYLLIQRVPAARAGMEENSGPQGLAYKITFALLAAAIFAAHPVNSEPVAWISAVPELTFTLFLLLSFYLFVRAMESGASGIAAHGLSLAAYVLSLLSKETAMSLLPLIAAYGFLKAGKTFARRWKLYSPYLLITAGYMALHAYAVGEVLHHKQIELSAFAIGINIFKLIAQYAVKLVLPTDLSALYEFHPASAITDPWVAAGIIISAAYLASIFLWRSNPVVVSSLILIGAPLLPVLYFPALASAARADRYLYLPTAGFSMLLAYSGWGAIAAIRRRHMQDKISRVVEAFVPVVFIALITAYSFASAKRTQVWKDDYTLWNDTVQKSPGSPTAHYNLAMENQIRGNLSAAQTHYLEAIRLFPDYADARYNLGVLYISTHRLQDAQHEFNEVLRINPGDGEARQMLAEIEGRGGLDLTPPKR